MSRESRMLGGILLVVIPTVMYGGLTLLCALTRNVPGYNDNPGTTFGAQATPTPAYIWCFRW